MDTIATTEVFTPYTDTVLDQFKLKQRENPMIDPITGLAGFILMDYCIKCPLFNGGTNFKVGTDDHRFVCSGPLDLPSSVVAVASDVHTDGSRPSEFPYRPCIGQ